MSKNMWELDSWKKYKIEQQPKWPKKKSLDNVLSKLEKLPSLVFSGETRKLKEEINEVNKRKKFILQVGNCAESFSDCHGPKIHNFLRILLQMSMVIENKAAFKVTKIGRIAGQYAKPRSSDYEVIDGEKILSYRGDIVNSYNPNEQERIPDPNRLLEGYFRSAATLNLIRAFIQGGYGNIENLLDWKEHFFNKQVLLIVDYKYLERELNHALKIGNNSILNNQENSEVYISHEALLLDYEQAFTRIDTTYEGYYDTSAHFLWIGDRTRSLESAHIEFVKGIGNPIGIKLGPKYELEEVVEIIKKINPNNESDKIVLIIRMGADKILEKLEPIIKKVRQEGLNVIWMSDPMHGNTFKHGDIKVRDFNDIVKELNFFFGLCKKFEIIPGGVHLEITAEKVTECVGGIDGLNFTHLKNNYGTKVDPRLNASQALELAFIIGNLLNETRRNND